MGDVNEKRTWSGNDLEELDMRIADIFECDLFDIRSCLEDINRSFEDAPLPWIKHCVEQALFQHAKGKELHGPRSKKYWHDDCSNGTLIP